MKLMGCVAEKFAKILIAKLPKESWEGFLENIQFFEMLLDENKIFKNFMYSYNVQKISKINIMKLLTRKLDCVNSDILMNLIILLIKSDNLRIFSDIKQAFRKNMLRMLNVTEAKICFASEPSDKQIKNIKHILIEKYKVNPEMSVSIDESIIGGYIVSFDGKMLDASVNNSFNKFLESLQEQIALGESL